MLPELLAELLPDLVADTVYDTLGVADIIGECVFDFIGRAVLVNIIRVAVPHLVIDGELVEDEVTLDEHVVE